MSSSSRGNRRYKKKVKGSTESEECRETRVSSNHNTALRNKRQRKKCASTVLSIFINTFLQRSFSIILFGKSILFSSKHFHFLSGCAGIDLFSPWALCVQLSRGQKLFSFEILLPSYLRFVSANADLKTAPGQIWDCDRNCSKSDRKHVLKREHTGLNAALIDCSLVKT